MKLTGYEVTLIWSCPNMNSVHYLIVVTNLSIIHLVLCTALRALRACRRHTLVLYQFVLSIVSRYTALIHSSSFFQFSYKSRLLLFIVLKHLNTENLTFHHFSHWSHNFIKNEKSFFILLANTNKVIILLLSALKTIKIF